MYIYIHIIYICIYIYTYNIHMYIYIYTPPNLNVAPANKKQGFQHSPCSSKTPGEVIYIG